MTEDEKKSKKDVIRQEQFWFTATTATLIGVQANLLKSPDIVTVFIAIMVILVLSGFTIYLLVDRSSEYCKIDKNQDVKMGFCDGLCWAIKEKSGSLYCLSIVVVAAIGFSTIILFSTSNANTKEEFELKQGTRITIHR